MVDLRYLARFPELLGDEHLRSRQSQRAQIEADDQGKRGEKQRRLERPWPSSCLDSSDLS